MSKPKDQFLVELQAMEEELTAKILSDTVKHAEDGVKMIETLTTLHITNIKRLRTEYSKTVQEMYEVIKQLKGICEVQADRIAELEQQLAERQK